MDWQNLFTSLAGAAITLGVPAGVFLLKQYTGIKISAENEASIREAAMTEAGKLITLGVNVNQQTANVGASKVLSDLARQNLTEKYTHDDIKDMIVGAASKDKLTLQSKT